MREVARDVVGVAILDEGRVLAARRAHPPELAGFWELPGGKVERGESIEAAAVREMHEELGCAVEVTGVLDGSSAIGHGLSLRVVLARLAGGDPVPHEHDAVRWLEAVELGEVTWAGADVPFLDALRERMVTR
jgi:8-oxo-dGTP diphosphatase